MKVELSKEEAQNVLVALVNLAKSPNANLNEMKVLLILSEKFIWLEPEAKKEEVKANLEKA